MSDIPQILKNHGIAPTQQRVEIASVLLAKPQHLSADQILGIVNRANNVVSKATVYNTLGLFSRKGLVREVIIDPTKVFYDSNVAPHHHFYNTETGELTDVNAAQLNLQSLPQPPTGTQCTGVDIIIRVAPLAGA